jgi:hypothetical protein
VRTVVSRIGRKSMTRCIYFHILKDSASLLFLRGHTRHVFHLCFVPVPFSFALLVSSCLCVCLLILYCGCLSMSCFPSMFCSCAVFLRVFGVLLLMRLSAYSLLWLFFMTSCFPSVLFLCRFPSRFFVSSCLCVCLFALYCGSLSVLCS